MISVIIPTFNEAENIAKLLENISNSNVAKEVLVIDGGSDDNTVAIAKNYDVIILTSEPGRGKQLCLGVKHARGNILLFIHGDSCFLGDGLSIIDVKMKKYPNLIGGNFQVRFDGEDRFSLWLNGFYEKARRKGFYYGDSGIFIRKQSLVALGGLKPLAIMEDYDLVRRMEKGKSRTIFISDIKLLTSSRRFKNRKSFSIITGWILIHVGYFFRLPSSWLYRFYQWQKPKE